MKALIMLPAFLCAAIVSVAQETAQPSAGSAASDSVTNLFTGIGVAAGAVFIFAIIYSLAKALKVLAAQSASK